MGALLDSSDGFFGWLWRASWQAGVVVILVLLAQWLLGRKLTPRWRHALWFLVVLRLALPGSLECRTSVFNFFSPHSISMVAVVSGPGSPAAAEDNDARPPGSPDARLGWKVRSWGSLRSIWLGGTAVFLVILIASAWRLRRTIGRQRPVTTEAVLNLLEDCKEEMGVFTPLTLLETGTIKSPALLGFIRPRLLLPEGLLQTFSLPELRFVFLHELGHLKRGDILLNWLMAVPLALHWFNPLVWFAVNRMRADGEAACDAVALSHAREGENQPYGQTIIKLLERFSGPTAAPGVLGILENRNQMQRRIDMIAKFKKTNRRPALAVSLFVILALLTLTDATSQSAVGAGKSENDASKANAHWRPSVIAYSPRVGAREVDPATSEIVITFDRDMASGYSWTGAKEYFPPMRQDQKIFWRDRRTCVLPVKLEAGHYYRVGVNDAAYQNFRGTDGRAADNSVIYFTTRGASDAVKARLLKPRITSLSPPNGATDVDPSLNEIRVTFDMPMGRDFSWCGQGEDFPGSTEITNARWIDDHTCVLPVELKPNRPYHVWVNSISAVGFQSADGGVPSDPVEYSFRTKN